MTDKKLTAIFEFTDCGYLRAILLNAGCEEDQITLERALDRLIRPQHTSWIKRLFGRGQRWMK
jgi:hypothetical protein